MKNRLLVILLFFVLTLTSCSIKTEYSTLYSQDQLESVHIVEVQLDDNGILLENEINSFSDEETITEFISDLRSIECEDVLKHDPVGLMPEDQTAVVFKLVYGNGDIEYINYYGQSTIINGYFRFYDASAYFDPSEFSTLVDKYS